MNFTEKARPFKKLLDDLVERPYAFVKDQMVCQSSLIKRSLNNPCRPKAQPRTLSPPRSWN